MNRPVFVGIAQILQRVTDPLAGKEPVKLMQEAITLAGQDSGNPKLIQAIESIRVIRGVWRYRQPATYLAEQLGIDQVETVGTPFGGNLVQLTVNQSALEIQRGEKSVIAITGAEIGNSIAKARKAGIQIPYTELPGQYDRMMAEEIPMASVEEMASGISQPIQVYPMFENALRYAGGESIETHIKRVSELWAGFSRVAKDNPHAWLREAVAAKTIRTSSASNRLVSFPYPKLMNANNAVDMAAALIMCSLKKAKELGIPEQQWVYPWVGTDAHDTYYVSHRENFHSSPAIRIAGAKALAMADLSPLDLDYVDIYSCFPSAVQIAANELGLDQNRPLTITGGLTFGGGPMNNYVTHSIARMVAVLRAKPGDIGMITANGGYLAKHAFGIYSTEPAPFAFRHADLQAEVDQTPQREVIVKHQGKVTLESYTIMFGLKGTNIAHTACLLPDGRRTWANTADPDVMLAMTKEEFCGRSAKVSQGKISF